MDTSLAGPKTKERESGFLGSTPVLRRLSN
jgi:hypothetical protein